MLYLLTTPHRNVFGCYQLPMSYALEDTQLPIDSFSKAWEMLIESGMVSYDKETRMVLIKNFLRYNPLDGPKQVAGAVTKLRDLPRTNLFLDLIAFLEKQDDKPALNALINAIRETQGNVNDIPADSISDTLTDTLSDTLSNTEPIEVYSISNSISNSKQYPVESNIPPISPQGETQSPTEKSQSLRERRFDEFWMAYPKKVGKAAAQKSWIKIKPSAELHDKIIKAIEAQKRSDQWTREDGRFIPNPATWLNQGRWDDEVQEVSKYGNGNNRQYPRPSDRPFTLSGFRPAGDED